jgi:hypothetical protein
MDKCIAPAAEKLLVSRAVPGMSHQVLAICCLMLSTCAAATAQDPQHFPEYPVQPPSRYAISTRQNDVSIGIKPVDSAEDQQTYFHTILSSKGFLPVFVVIHNRSKTDSLLLDKGSITCGSGASDASSPNENSGAQKAQIASAGFIPFIGPFISAGMTQGLSEVKQNLVLHELQSETLSPGETMHGFLYVPVPKKGPRRKIHLRIPIAWSGSDNTSVQQLTF